MEAITYLLFTQRAHLRVDEQMDRPMDYETLFTPFELVRGLTLRNRMVMAPMTTWAGNDDGTVSVEEEAYYRARVKDVGMVITGCTHVQANGIGFTGEFAAYDDRFISSLARLAAAAKSGGAPAVLQLFHAGVKTLPELASDVVAASSVPGEAGPFVDALTPRALTDSEIEEVVRSFGQATRRAILAGFDGVELHGAHGFLIQNFFSPHFNRRTDRWGGSLENRMRFPLAIAEEVRGVITKHADRPFVLGYRISPDEPNADGLRISESLVLIDRLIGTGIDYLHASLGDVHATTPVGSLEGTTTLQILHDHVNGRLPLIAAGSVRTPEQAQQAIAGGLSLVAIGKALVMNPDWVNLASNNHADLIVSDVAAQDVEPLSIPPKLWTVIEDTPGWFAIRQPA